MTEQKKLSEAVRELAYLPRGETYPLYSTMQQCLADEIAALEKRLAEANDYIRYTADKGTRFLGKHEEAVSFAMQENIHD